MIEFPSYQKPDVIIAIDPDVTKSGVCMLQPKTRDLKFDALDFPNVLELIRTTKDLTEPGKLVVVVEAGWMNKSNWHLLQYDSNAQAARKGYDVGRNHETGHKIVEVCKALGIRVVEHIPLVKRWRGKDGKITHEELAYFTGITKRTNQDERDAILLAWNFAALPIRVKVRH
jgi:hypothetical protein